MQIVWKHGYEYVIEDMSLAVLPVHEQVCTPVFVLKPETLQWYKIDDESDLKYAQENLQMSYFYSANLDH